MKSKLMVVHHALQFIRKQVTKNYFGSNIFKSYGFYLPFPIPLVLMFVDTLLPFPIPLALMSVDTLALQSHGI